MLKTYSSLPRKGKPGDNEWTVLAGIVLQLPSQPLQTVSLATGTKCLSADRMLLSGEAINDSHAEVLARRGFIRFALSQLKQPSSTLWQPGPHGAPYQLDPAAQLHLYISEVPCGEASMQLYRIQQGVTAELQPEQPAPAEQPGQPEQRPSKRPRVEKAGPGLPGAAHHAAGLLSTKPGRNGTSR